MLFGHQVLMEYVYYYVLKIKTEASNVEKKTCAEAGLYELYIKFYTNSPCKLIFFNHIFTNKNKFNVFCDILSTTQSCALFTNLGNGKDFK